MTDAPQTPEERRLPRVSPWFALGLGALVLLGFVVMGDVEELAGHMRRWPMETLLGVLGLSLAGYGIRAARWSVYLRRLDIALPAGDSAHVFFAGMVGSITPGKVGEVIKSALLEKRHGIPVARTAPIVLAERVGDLLALVLLALKLVQRHRARVVVASAVGQGAPGSSVSAVELVFGSSL